MSQLDDFREVLRRARPEGKKEKELPEAEVQTPPASKKMGRKKDDSPERAAVWIPKDVQRKLRLLCVWLESERLKETPTIGELASEAVENLIETKYPKAKMFLKRL